MAARLLVPLALFAVATTLIVLRALAGTGGHWAYPLDDTYIHLAMAKNAALHGVWGVTRHEFTSATSSPLWTALIALAVRIFGVRDWIPLALSLAAAVGAIAALAAWLRARGVAGGRAGAITSLAMLAAPLPAMAISGMEHALHAWLAVLFLGALIETLEVPDREAMPRLRLPALAALLVMTRYEGAFLVGLGALALAARRRWGAGLVVGVAGVVPVVLYGAWCVVNGWSWLPNSILLKGNIPKGSLGGLAELLGRRALDTLWDRPHLLLLVGLAALAALRAEPGDRTGARRATLGILIGAIVLHVQFASTGWFYRYEAYLVFLGLGVLGATALGRGLQTVRAASGIMGRAAALVVLGLVTWPFVERASSSWSVAPRATVNIHEQQVQMAAFLGTYYTGEVVAVNDIGAVSYYADVRLLDLWGLGSREPARLRLAGRYDSDAIAALVRERGVRVVVVYRQWFDEFGGVPREWIPVGSWTVHDNVVLGGDTVTFYAPDAAGAGELRERLREFARRLPAGVTSELEGSGATGATPPGPPRPDRTPAGG